MAKKATKSGPPSASSAPSSSATTGTATATPVASRPATPAPASPVVTMNAALPKPAPATPGARPAAPATAASPSMTPNVGTATLAKPAVQSSTCCGGSTACSTTKPASQPSSKRPSFEQIAAKARDIWYSRGCPSGKDMENWLEAERQLAESVR